MDIVERFADPEDLLAAVRRQRVVQGDEDAARSLVSAGKLVGFAPGEALIKQGAFDRHALLLLAGKVGLNVNGCDLPYARGAGEMIGEISAINPELSRTATCTALEPVAALRVEHGDLLAIGDAGRRLWLLLGVELSRKLEQRNQFVDVANKVPRVFMISSKEMLEIAQEIQSQLSRKADVVLWSDEEIFSPGSYPLDDLRRQVALADFGVALAHPDDVRRSRGRQTDVPRDNVVFEIGFFMSVLGRERTLVLVPDYAKVETPSDFKGLTPLKYSQPNDRVPIATTLAPTVRSISKVLERLKVRSKLDLAK